MPKKDMEELIRWRDATADNHGDDLICKIQHHLTEREVPGEHQAAQQEFRALPDSAQYGLIAKTVGEVGEPTLTRASWDWKQPPDLSKLRQALEPLGIYVYEDPFWDGSDAFGFIFSQIALDQDDVDRIGAEEPDP